MSARILPWLSSILITTTAGCTTLKQTDQASGALDAAMMLIGHAPPNVAPIETTTSGGGEVAMVRAVAGGRGVIVRGCVEKQCGSDCISARSCHIDVTVLNSDGKIIESRSTSFFPTEVPHNSSRWGNGRSYFSVRLVKKLPSGCKIRVAFHNVPNPSAR